MTVPLTKLAALTPEPNVWSTLYKTPDDVDSTFIYCCYVYGMLPLGTKLSNCNIVHVRVGQSVEDACTAHQYLYKDLTYISTSTDLLHPDVYEAPIGVVIRQGESIAVCSSIANVTFDVSGVKNLPKK